MYYIDYYLLLDHLLLLLLFLFFFAIYYYYAITITVKLLLLPITITIIFITLTPSLVCTQFGYLHQANRLGDSHLLACKDKQQ